MKEEVTSNKINNFENINKIIRKYIKYVLKAKEKINEYVPN
jgi:hypothetical protein